MKGIELYINKQLCDTGNSKDLSIYFKRQFLNPTELSTKDAQRSYDIVLPASAANNAIFGYINVEEVKNKFANLYDAVLMMGEVKIFEGKFKLSEVTHKQYRGNLGIPKLKTIKEIFEGKKMNEIGEWRIPFDGYQSISQYNIDSKDSNPNCIFPLVMYGLLPKVPEKMVEKKAVYSGKSVIDHTVRFGIDDFPPSVNCLATLRRLFANKGFNLTGTAFNDERLNSLYISYRNPSTHFMPWNYGKLTDIKISGMWTNGTIKESDYTGINANKPRKPSIFEQVGHMSTNELNEESYTCDLLNCSNSEINIITDSGNNISNSKFEEIIEDKNNNNIKIKRTRINNRIRIPCAGYYKVSLKGNLFIPNADITGDLFAKFNHYDKNTDLSFLGGTTGTSNFLGDIRYELKLIRDNNKGDLRLAETSIDGIYFKNNERQEKENLGKHTLPRYSMYPNIITNSFVADNDYKPCQMHFVDPEQNTNTVMGFSWGRWNGSDYKINHPLDNDGKNIGGTNLLQRYVWAQNLVGKSCFSWNAETKEETLPRIVVNNQHGQLQYDPKDIEIENEMPDREHTRKDFQLVNKYTMTLLGSPVNYARRGFHKGKPMYNKNDDDKTYIRRINQYADGEMHAIVWFDKGELVTVVSSSDRGKNRAGGSNRGWVWHQIDFELSIEPFRINKDWAKINEYSGSTTQYMFWNDVPTNAQHKFPTEGLDLIKFLPSGVAVDDWVDNFCKTFNLDLVQTDDTNFDLSIKRELGRTTSIIIDLDTKAHVKVNRSNSSLDLPAEYKIGFTVDKDEQGFVDSKDDGGGTFNTGSSDPKTVTMNSAFSHNWMKKMNIPTKPTTPPPSEGTNPEGEIVVPKPPIEYAEGSFPLISDKEVWKESNSDYGDMMQKDYIDKTQRFWYKSNELYDALINNKVPIKAALVTDRYCGATSMTLDYKNKDNSILNNYFTLFADADNCYTVVECYLTADEYNKLGNCMIKFNGDYYFVAEVDGYDPLERKTATLKLIRKAI